MVTQGQQHITHNFPWMNSTLKSAVHSSPKPMAKLKIALDRYFHDNVIIAFNKKHNLIQNENYSTHLIFWGARFGVSASVFSSAA